MYYIYPVELYNYIYISHILKIFWYVLHLMAENSQEIKKKQFWKERKAWMSGWDDGRIDSSRENVLEDQVLSFVLIRNLFSLRFLFFWMKSIFFGGFSGFPYYFTRNSCVQTNITRHPIQTTNQKFLFNKIKIKK